jgi:hypothetical protein
MGIELTTVDAVKSWLSGQGKSPSASTDDDNIQACITMWSWIFLCKSGFTTDSDVPEDSPFNTPIEYDEVYDGTGHGMMFLRNSPIQTVTSLSINGSPVTLSSGYGSTGFLINTARTALVISGGSGVAYSGVGGGACFNEGVQNIHIVYTAGYTRTPPDIERACVKQVALTYKRRDWIGLKSKTMSGGAGTTSYQDYECDAEVEGILGYYQKVIPV